MRGRGVGAGLVLLIALSAACASNAKVASPEGTRSSTGPRSSNPSIIGGIPVPTTVVTPKPLPSGRIAHAIEIAEGIRATGDGCATASLETDTFHNATPGDPKEQVSCTIGDDSIAITLFADHATLVRSTSLIRQGVCFTAEQQKDLNLTSVVGDNWIVFPQRVTTARRLASRLHASLAVLQC